MNLVIFAELLPAQFVLHQRGGFITRGTFKDRSKHAYLEAEIIKQDAVAALPGKGIEAVAEFCEGAVVFSTNALQRENRGNKAYVRAGVAVKLLFTVSDPVYVEAVG